ncbi:MAG: cation-translocating P-type ATPase [Symbiobacteriia bacterium]
MPTSRSARVVHSLPGRLRARIPALGGNPAAVRLVIESLTTEPGVTAVEGSPYTTGLLILFDASATDEVRLIAAVERALAFVSPSPRATVTRSMRSEGRRSASGPLGTPRPPSPRRVIAVGLILLGLWVKRRFFRQWPFARRPSAIDAAAVITITTTFPFLERGLRRLLSRGRIDGDTAIILASIASVLLRESLLGLAILWLTEVNELVYNWTLYQSRRAVAPPDPEEENIRLSSDGAEETVAIGRVRPGHRVAVHAGEVVPVDGVIVRGRALVREGALTGEAGLAAKRPQDPILAGTFVEDGRLEVEVRALGAATQVGHFTALAQDAAQEWMAVASWNAEFTRRAERTTPWFLLAAAITYAATQDLRRAMAVLVAAAPATAGLASASAAWFGTLKLQREQILPQKGNVLEAAGRIDSILFDKTGTLTGGGLGVSDVISLQSEWPPEDIITWAAAAEQGAEHPIARALTAAATAGGARLPAASHQRQLPGLGVVAMINGLPMLVGQESFLRSQHISVRKARGNIARLRQLGRMAACVAINNEMVGVIGLTEEMRPEAPATLARLRAMGVDSIDLVTGDRSSLPNQLGEKLRLNSVYTAADPADKLKIVASMRRQGKVVMLVGDGANDAPALAAANLGVALGSPPAVPAVAAADVVIPSGDLRKVPHLLRIGKATDEVGRQNFAIFQGFTAAGVGLAAAGILPPQSAALLHNITSLLILASGARLLPLGPKAVRAPQPPGQDPAPVPAPPKPENRRREPSSHPLRPTNLQLAPHHLFPVTTPVDWERGLAPAEAQARLQHFGPNALREQPKPSFLQLVLEQLRDVTVLFLLGGTGVALFVGRLRDALTIGAVVVLNAFIGAAQQGKADSSLDALKKLSAPASRVVRGGMEVLVPTDSLVPGDVLVLEAGDRVPADGVLLRASNFEVEEAILTGESLPVTKAAGPCLIAPPTAEERSVLERVDMVFMGTSIVRGRARAMVTATGMATEVGQIALMLESSENARTPLQTRMDELGHSLLLGSLAICGSVALAGLLRGMPVLDVLMTAIGLAVAAVPEGLPTFVTIGLAMGVHQMAKRRALVRVLSAVESLGSVTVICSDKTGTITHNQMVIRSLYTAAGWYEITGSGYRPEGTILRGGTGSSAGAGEGADLGARTGDAAAPADLKAAPDLMRLLLVGALCNDARLVEPDGPSGQDDWSVVGDPAEGALLVAAVKGGLEIDRLAETYVRQAEIPFDSDRRRMSVLVHDDAGRRLLCVKGAPETILPLCSQVMHGGEEHPLDAAARSEIAAATAAMAGRALRVLALAYCPLADNPDPAPSSRSSDAPHLDELESGLTFAGLAGMMDPARKEIRPALDRCRRAGIRVLILTGDHRATAAAVGSDIGLVESTDEVASGDELDSLDDESLALAVDQMRVLARISPRQKLRVVKALKRRGHVVAMIGDGVNDAPALREADIGIAMGRTGTDVARHASGLVLADDNFSTVLAAVEQGRTTYANIRKAIYYLLASNMGEVVLMFASSVSGLPLALTPVQLLWVNMVGDGLPAVALNYEPSQAGVMDRPPRPREQSVFDGGLKEKILSHGLQMGVAAAGLYAISLGLGIPLATARTMALSSLATGQLLHLFESRLAVERTPGVLPPPNPMIGAAAGVSLAMLVGSLYTPGLRRVFDLTPLGAGQWLAVLLAAVAGSPPRSVLALAPERDRQHKGPGV